MQVIWCALIGLFRPCTALEAEVLVLRHQLNVLRRASPKRVALNRAVQTDGRTLAVSIFGGLHHADKPGGGGLNAARAWIPAVLAL